MNPEIMLLLASEHQAELARRAAWESQVERIAAARRDRLAAPGTVDVQPHPSRRLIPRRA